MSAAAATADAAAAPKKGKKKLILIVVVLLLVLLGGGGAALFMMKKKAAEAAEAEEGGGAPAAHAPAAAHKVPPTFVALDPFVVNLADRDGERYAQVGLTLEVDDPKFGEEMKAYMPAVRSAILLILAHKTSQQLLTAEGKEALAEEIMREAVRPMGIEIDPPEADGGDGAGAGHDDETPRKAKPGRKKKKRHEVHNPVQRVHFASFIIQ